MAELFNVSFADNSSFPLVKVGANGIFDLGSNYPTGISGRLEIVDGALKSTLYSTDAPVNGGLRSEVEIGTFPTNSGIYSTSFEFMIPADWTYKGFIYFSSWYPTHDVGDAPNRHVPFGLRILNGHILVQVPQNFAVESNIGKTILRHPIEIGRWHKVTQRANLQTDSTGFREVYLNNAPILRDFGLQTVYDDVGGPFLKLAVYTGSATDFDSLTMYFRNARVWSGNESYQIIMGGPPVTPKRTQNT